MITDIRIGTRELEHMKPGAGLTMRHEVRTEEHLDRLAARFSAMEIWANLSVPFGAYIREPDHYDTLSVQAAVKRTLIRLLPGLWN